MRVFTAAVFTILWSVLIFFGAAFVMIGDCAAPAEQCFRAQRISGWSVIAFGLAILVVVDWLILKRRKS